MSICYLLNCEKGAGILSILMATMMSYMDLFSFKFTYKKPLFAFLIFCIAVFTIIQLYNKPISFLCSCCFKKNENTDIIVNEHEEEAPLKSSPAIALEIKRLEKISNEINNAQSEQSKKLIKTYGNFINKILFSLKIDINMK
jgi:hypothetical protein